MRASFTRIIGLVALCLVAATVFSWRSPRSPAADPPTPPGRPLLVHNAFEATLREARAGRLLAHSAARRDFEAIEQWDPVGFRSLDWNTWRRLQVAADRRGDLRRARAAALRATALGRSEEERYRATACLAIIECDLDHHEAELKLARQLVALEPGKAESLAALQHAAKCTGLRGLERQAEAALLPFQDQEREAARRTAALGQMRQKAYQELLTGSPRPPAGSSRVPPAAHRGPHTSPAALPSGRTARRSADPARHTGG